MKIANLIAKFKFARIEGQSTYRVTAAGSLSFTSSVFRNYWNYGEMRSRLNNDQRYINVYAYICLIACIASHMLAVLICIVLIFWIYSREETKQWHGTANKHYRFILRNYAQVHHEISLSDMKLDVFAHNNADAIAQSTFNYHASESERRETASHTVIAINDLSCRPSCEKLWCRETFANRIKC